MATFLDFIHSFKSEEKHLVQYNNQCYRKILLNSLLSNGHKLGFCPVNQNLDNFTEQNQQYHRQALLRSFHMVTFVCSLKLKSSSTAEAGGNRKRMEREGQE